MGELGFGHKKDEVEGGGCAAASRYLSPLWIYGRMVGIKGGAWGWCVWWGGVGVREAFETVQAEHTVLWVACTDHEMRRRYHLCCFVSFLYRCVSCAFIDCCLDVPPLVLGSAIVHCDAKTREFSESVQTHIVALHTFYARNKLEV